MAKVHAPSHMMKRRSGILMTVYFQMTVTRMMAFVLCIAGRMDDYGVYRCIVLA